jgi:hypothetical protein
MATRVISPGTLHYPATDLAWPNATVKLIQKRAFVVGGVVYPKKMHRLDTDSSGVTPALTVAVPDDGAIPWGIILPDGSDYEVSIGAGIPISLDSLLLTAGLEADDQNEVAELIDAEATARASADSALDARVDTLERHTTAQTLADAASIAWDTSAGHLASVTLGGNRTLAAPSSGVAGTYVLRVTQDATGSRTLAYNAVFKWAGGTAPVLSTTAGAVDVLSFVSYDGATFYGSCLKGFA